MLHPKYSLLFSILLFSVFSCKDTNEYRVAEDFSVYVNRFEAEANARGRTFDLKGNGLIIEFADFKLTIYSHHDRIENCTVIKLGRYACMKEC